MKSQIELTLQILECCLKNGGVLLSIKDLHKKTKASKNKIKCIISVLEKREYLIKIKDSDFYALNKKLAMLI